jgi:hypothetical protein
MAYFPGTTDPTQNFWAGLIAQYVGGKRAVNRNPNDPDANNNIIKLLLCPSASDVATTATASASTMYWGTNNLAWNGLAAPFNYPGPWFHVAANPGVSPERWWVGSYGFNMWMYSNNLRFDKAPQYNSKLYFSNITDVRPASNTPMFFDCMWVDAQVQLSLEQDASGNSGTNDPTPSNLTGCTQPGNLWPGNNNMTQRVCLNRHSMTINAVMADGSGTPIRLSDLHRMTWFHGEIPTKFIPPLPQQ